jgi:CBS domain-containing protein
MANNVATRAGQVVAGLLIAGGVAFIFWPDGSTIQGVWMIFIGWYLFSAVSTMRGQLQVKGYLTGFKVKDAMARTCPMVPHSLTLDNLVEGYIMPTGCRVFLVSSFSEPRGIVTTTQVRLVPRDRWREVRVENVMVPLDRIPSVAAQEDAYRVLEKMAEADVTELPVVEEGKVIGLVSREDLLRVASTRSELGR